MDQMQLFCDVLLAVGKQKNQLKTSTMNLIIKSCDAIIAEEEPPSISAAPGMALYEWLDSDDTGLSSEFMAAVLLGQSEAAYSHPVDASDFGRCYRFLRAVNRRDITKMSAESDQWKKLVENWPELEKMYETKDPALSKKLDELLKDCEK